MPKPFLTYEQQLIKLRDEKHLVITDESATCCKLRQISYYSLVSGYKHLFRIPSQKIYKDGTTFEESYHSTNLMNRCVNCFSTICYILNDTSAPCFLITSQKNMENHRVPI